MKFSKGRIAPEAGAQGPNNLSSYLQLFLIKVAQPLQGGHLVEAIQEGFGLFFHAPGETPVGQQPKNKDWLSVGPETHCPGTAEDLP